MQPPPVEKEQVNRRREADTDEGLQRLRDVLLFFHRFPDSLKSDRRSQMLETTQASCVSLMERDEPLSLLDNTDGQLCPSYPLQIALFHPLLSNPSKVHEAVMNAKYARYRQRVAVPAFTFRGRLVCRSAAPSALQYIQASLPCEVDAQQHYRHDRQLLDTYSVHYLLNMMTEVTVQEDGLECCVADQIASREIYCSHPLNLCVLPYPGVKLFKEWKQSKCNEVEYDWRKCEAQLEVPQTLQPDHEWLHHQSWDLQTLTQKYFSFMVSLLAQGGLLIHCRSGWDRTPLWISLLRISLWADGELHPSLSASEIVYLAVSYDWLLFGHQFGRRQRNGEAIMLFAFHFLSAIHSNEYSIHTHLASSSPSGASHGVDERSSARRKERLEEVRRIFTQVYSACFDPKP